ncbi:MAG: hypothetical protein V4773_13530 [Verrucomicrobiota bacterium]
MSNHKYAYGWDGHIITSKEETKSNKQDNVIAVPQEVFDRLVKDMGDCKLDPRIEAHQLGWLAIEEVYFVATGRAFSESFAHYGTVFEEAEMLEGGNEPISRADRNRDYIAAMKEIYGIQLPPCQLMVGCSSEH